MKKTTALAIVLPLAPVSVYAYRLLQEKRSAVPRNYDVFLNFKGPDTGTCFTDFLYNSQVAAGFYVFRDDDPIPVGVQIGQEKLRAIKSCRITIPIISEQYAQSKQCLCELTEIVDCHRKHGKSVFPVFYKVDGGDVRRQRVNFEKALRKPEMPISAEEMEKWWNALTSVARIKGWISQTIANGHEAELVKMVVAKVSSDLKAMWIERLPMFISSGIRVFNDDDPSLIGKDVDHEICNAIDHCKISIPILSEDYASSCWCLDEHAQMVECNRTKRQKILPIFYKVRTMHVRDLSGVFGEKILKHEKLVDESTCKRWKRALKEVGSFKGWVSERIANGHEGVLVKEVVKEVSRLLKNPQTHDPLSLATEY